MRIDYAIMSSNSDNFYLDFWPLISKIWNQKFKITPVLLYHGIKREIDNSNGIIEHIPLINDIPEYVQCQWSRFWFLTTIKEKVGIITDIDMIPISVNYFIKQIECLENNYVHLNPCIDTYPNIPACYHVCPGDIFKEIMNISDSFEKSLRDLLIFSKNKNTKNGASEYWYADEIYSTYAINNYHKRELIFLKRKNGQNGFRIDRNSWGYDIKLLQEEYYYDCHCIRPFQKYKSEIEHVVNLVLKNE